MKIEYPHDLNPLARSVFKIRASRGDSRYFFGFGAILGFGVSSSPGGGALTLPRPADGGTQPSFEGPFWKKNEVLLSGWPL